MLIGCIKRGYQNKFWFIIQRGGGILEDQEKDGPDQVVRNGS